MPEFIEINLIVESVQQAIGLEVTSVTPLGNPYTTENGRKNFEELLTKIKAYLPFVIKAIVQRGKEIAIICTQVTLMITFGQGNYLSYLTNADDLKKEPFLSDGYLSLENKDNNKTLVLVDCRNYKHQIHIRVCSNLEKHTAFWNKERGPCILNELSLHIENLKEKFKTHPHYFYSHSLAYVLFDYSIFNGFGEYTVSEILFRLMKQFKVKPFEWAVNALKDDSFFSALMAAPKIFHHEITKYYLNVFNPTTFTKKQLQERNRFRHDCIKVYRRKSVGKSKEKVIAFKLKTGTLI